MEAKELRIGNWIKCNDTQMQVTSIMSHSVGVEQGNIIGAIHNNDIEPIPLTDGWLTKWGFEWDQVTHGKGKLMVGQRRDGTWSVYYGTFSYGCLDECIITYVHQLQNIYFALTGQELEVQP